MLKPMERTIQISSGSVINVKKGKEQEALEVAGFSMTINSNDPLAMGLNAWVNDREIYNQNIAQCRADEDAFRTYARQLQDEMIAALESGETENVPEVEG